MVPDRDARHEAAPPAGATDHRSGVIRRFRTVALSVAEVETGLLSLKQRLRKQAIALWMSIHKLGQSQPHRMIKRQPLCAEHWSPVMGIAEMCDNVRVGGVLEIKAYACPPWVARPEVAIVEDGELIRPTISCSLFRNSCEYFAMDVVLMFRETAACANY